MTLIFKIKLLCLFFFLLSCSNNSDSDILNFSNDNSTSANNSYLVITGQDGNHRGVAFYDTDGELLTSTDFRAEAGTPRGLSPFNDGRVLVSMDTTDALYLLNSEGQKTLFHGSVQFNGTIYGVAQDSQGLVYAVESNRIEAFDSDGLRLTSNYITTNVGSCSLSSPRLMRMNGDDQLIVLDAGGSDNIHVYDVTTTPATCLSSNAFGNNPFGLVLHSNGYLYITTQSDDRVYRADPDGSNPTVVWDTNTAIINNPTGIAELPNGDLIVASSSTDTIERITVDGVRVGVQPFIRDTQSLNVSDILITGANSEE